MSELATRPKRKGMMVKQRGSSGPYGQAHYQNQLIRVCDTLEHDQFGIGIVGVNELNNVPTVVFQHPIPSESRRSNSRVKSIANWVTGVSVGRNSFTIGADATMSVSDINFRFDLPSMEVVIDNEKYDAEVIFVQWSSCWKSVEQLNEDPQKDIFTGYAIARAFPAREGSDESLSLDIFYPHGDSNPFNSEEFEDEIYPVVFRFNSLSAMRKHVADEAKKYKNPFQNYLVRMIDAETGKIVGCGEFISCNPYYHPDTPIEDIFTLNMAKAFGKLTYKGLEKFIGTDGYAFELMGLVNIVPSIQKNDQSGRSLYQDILSSSRMVPRNSNGEQREIFAQPIAIRGRISNETFWMDKYLVLGKSGWNTALGDFGADSDIIGADAYSCSPLDERGHITERGLDRIFPEFEVVDPDNENEFVEVFAENIRDMAYYLGIEAVEPSPNLNYATMDSFLEKWDNREEAKIEKQETKSQSVASKPNTSAKAKAPIEEAPIEEEAKETKPVGQKKPARRAVPRPHNTATAVTKPSAESLNEEDALGPAFPSEAGGMDDVPF